MKYTCSTATCLFLCAATANLSLAVEQLLQFNHDLQKMVRQGEAGLEFEPGLDLAQLLRGLNEWSALEGIAAIHTFLREIINNQQVDDLPTFKKYYAITFLGKKYASAFTDKDFYGEEARQFLAEAEPLLNAIWKKIEEWRKPGFSFTAKKVKDYKSSQEALDELKNWLDAEEPPKGSFLAKATENRSTFLNQKVFKNKYLEDYLTDGSFNTNVYQNAFKDPDAYREKLSTFLKEAGHLLNKLWPKVEEWQRTNFSQSAKVRDSQTAGDALKELQGWSKLYSPPHDDSFLAKAVKHKKTFSNLAAFKDKYLIEYLEIDYHRYRNFQDAFKNKNRYRKPVRDFLEKAESLLEKLWPQVELWQKGL